MISPPPQIPTFDMYRADPACMDAYRKQHEAWANKEYKWLRAWAVLGVATMIAGAYGFYVFTQLWLALLQL